MTPQRNALCLRCLGPVKGHPRRGLCGPCYELLRREDRLEEFPSLDHGARGFVNPLVCLCPDTDADPRRDYGMCHRCGRKPLALVLATQTGNARR